MDSRIGDFQNRLSEIEREMKLLKEKVKEGKDSLGSKVEDFCFCVGLGRSEGWKPYIDLDRQMSKSAGDEILVVRSEIKTCSDRMRGVREYDVCLGPPIVHYNVNRKFGYGVLSGKGLDFDLEDDVIIFPVDNHWVEILVEDSHSIKLDFSGVSVERKVGRINSPAWELPHLYDTSRFLCMIENTSEILVGSEVGEYFNKAVDGKNCYCRVKEVLG